mgnify:CR=1 FL=1
METDYLSYPHRCRNTGLIVEGSRIPECYACTFFKERAV